MPSATKPPFQPLQPPTDPEQEQALAWLGDAVLALWARERILRETGGIQTETFLRLTSNAFLLSVGRPTKVEAEFGQIYQKQGLSAAFAYIEARLLPVYQRQEAKRRKARG